MRLSGNLFMVKQSEWNIRKGCSQRKKNDVTEPSEGIYWKRHILRRPWLGMGHILRKTLVGDIRKDIFLEGLGWG